MPDEEKDETVNISDEPLSAEEVVQFITDAKKAWDAAYAQFTKSTAELRGFESLHPDVNKNDYGVHDLYAQKQAYKNQKNTALSTMAFHLQTIVENQVTAHSSVEKAAVGAFKEIYKHGATEQRTYFKLGLQLGERTNNRELEKLLKLYDKLVQRVTSVKNYPDSPIHVGAEEKKKMDIELAKSSSPAPDASPTPAPKK